MQLKKRIISANEYIDLLTQKSPDHQQIKSWRVCVIDEGLYMIFDYFKSVPGQPITLIIQVNSEEMKRRGEDVVLPAYINTIKDITDLQEFMPFTMAQNTYKYEAQP